METWEPGRRLRWVEEMPGGGRGEAVRMVVDFRIEAREGGTRVRLVHSRFGEGADWDEHYEAVGGGWTYFLSNSGTTWSATREAPGGW